MTRLAAARQLYGSKALKSLMLSPWTARASMYRSATTLGNWHEVQRMGRCITLPDRPVCPSLLLLDNGLNARRSQTALKPLLAAQFRGRRTGYRRRRNDKTGFAGQAGDIVPQFHGGSRKALVAAVRTRLADGV